MNEEDKAKTNFVTPIGFQEFNRMPQGVTNAPSTFQQLMEKSMGDLHLKDILLFLDDFIVFSDMLEEHERAQAAEGIASLERVWTEALSRKM